MTTLPFAMRPLRQLAGAAALAVSMFLIAPAAHAQSAYDATLRSIAPATITLAGFDGRARQAIQSIAPSSLENQPNVVPAIYDPALGRFVSALGNNARGAISVNSTGAVSVLVSTQNGSVLIGSGINAVPLRSEPVISPASALTAQQFTTTTAATTAR